MKIKINNVCIKPAIQLGISQRGVQRGQTSLQGSYAGVFISEISELVFNFSSPSTEQQITSGKVTQHVKLKSSKPPAQKSSCGFQNLGCGNGQSPAAQEPERQPKRKHNLYRLGTTSTFQESLVSVQSIKGLLFLFI